MAKHRGTWPVGIICNMLGVSHSGFYAWRTRPASRRTQTDAALLGALRTSFALSDRTYGARRLRYDLRDLGFAVGLHRVERLMRVSAMRARPRRRARPTDTGGRSLHAIAPNLLDRQCTATAPNQKWVADFSYAWTTEGWLSVAVVLDHFSCRVVGWSMQATMTAQLVTDAQPMPVWCRDTAPSELTRSAQGAQYPSERFQRVLHAHGIVCSMSRTGNVWDNAVIESFFSTLKTQRSTSQYRSPLQFEQGVA